jgi:hypothetical protein
MIAALAWSAVPSVFLGRAKLPLASQLHDKVLYAASRLRAVDWRLQEIAVTLVRQLDP